VSGVQAAQPFVEGAPISPRPQPDVCPQAAQLFVEGAPSELCLPNCTQLDEASMVQLMQEGCSARLERLDLGCCGRGFGEAAAKVGGGSNQLVGKDVWVGGWEGGSAAANVCGSCGLREAVGRWLMWRGSLGRTHFTVSAPAPLAAAPHAGRSRALQVVAQAGPLDSLECLRLHGAYRLPDGAVGDLLEAAPRLRVLALPDCPRLAQAALGALPRLAAGLRELDLGGARGVDGQASGWLAGGPCARLVAPSRLGRPLHAPPGGHPPPCRGNLHGATPAPRHAGSGPGGAAAEAAGAAGAGRHCRRGCPAAPAPPPPPPPRARRPCCWATASTQHAPDTHRCSRPPARAGANGATVLQGGGRGD
jgi:hypothetical protein